MIFFDIDGTLLDHKGAELEGIKKFYEKYGFSQLTEFETFKNVWTLASGKNFDRYLKKEISFEEQRANRIIDVFKEFNMDITYEEALKKFEDYLIVYEESLMSYDDVITCLEVLKIQKLGIISNGDHEQQIKKLEKMGISSYFEDVITAGSLGVAKPNVRIFEIACERNAVEVEDSCYIGDDIKSDSLPCNEIGMKAVFINRNQKEVDRGIIQVNSLLELMSVLQIKRTRNVDMKR